MRTPANHQLVVAVESGEKFKIFGHEDCVYIFANLGNYSHIPSFLWTTACYHLQRLLDFRQLPDMEITHTATPDKVSCSLNILCILTGAGRTAMLRLCHCLICLQLSTGSSIYASASKRIVSVIAPMHNFVLCLCTGVFRMNRVESLYAESVESLYAESGEPVLATHQHILLCSYAANLSAIKKPPPT